MADNSQTELIEFNRKFKKAVLDVMFSVCDTFYIHCLPNPLLLIGKRGLLEKEKKEGIILVFGPYSAKHLSWDDNFIFCDMQFQGWEHVRIPYECIGRIFDKSGQVIMQWATFVSPDSDQQKEILEKKPEELPELGKPEKFGKANKLEGPDIKEEKQKTKISKSKVIEVDFSKKTKKD